MISQDDPRWSTQMVPDDPSWSQPRWCQMISWDDPRWSIQMISDDLRLSQMIPDDPKSSGMIWDRMISDSPSPGWSESEEMISDDFRPTCSQMIQMLFWVLHLNHGKSKENHGKSWEIMAIISMAFFGNFIVKLYFNSIFNILIDFFCFILV